MQRYAEKQVVPVIGLYTVDADRGFRQFVSLPSIIIEIALHNLKMEDVRFRVVPVVVDTEHEVPVDWCEDRTAHGYMGHAEEPMFQCFTFNNQFPTASYGQTSTAGDRMWKLACKEGYTVKDIGGISTFSDNLMPYYYTQLSVLMDELYQLGQESRDMNADALLLLQRIQTHISTFQKNWNVKLVERELGDFKWNEFDITVN